MKQAMYKRYEYQKPIAVMPLCNYFSLALFAPDDIDKYKDGCELIAAWLNGHTYYGFHKHMIFYSTAGRPFIRKGSLRLYLDEFQRCD